MKCSLIIVLVVIIFCGCAASTITELKNSPTIHEKYLVDENFQLVFKNINDKLYECGIFLKPGPVLISDRGIGYIQSSGADGVGFHVEIKRIDSSRTQVDVYSAFRALNWPNIVRMVKRGTYAEHGCP